MLANTLWLFGRSTDFGAEEFYLVIFVSKILAAEADPDVVDAEFGLEKLYIVVCEIQSFVAIVEVDPLQRTLALVLKSWILSLT